MGLLAITFAIVFHPDRVAATTLFQDNFLGDGMGGWTYHGGSETLVDDGNPPFAETSGNGDSFYSANGGAGWTNYSFTVDVIADDNDQMGVTFRQQDANNYYQLLQGFGDDGGDSLTLQSVVGGTPTDIGPSPINHPLAEPATHAFRVDVSGSNIKVWVNGILRYDVNDATFATGTVGLKNISMQNSSGYDNVLVSTIAPTTNYRSIGTASNYTAGSVTATAGSSVVTGTGTTWKSANRGRGDRIRINAVDYVVVNVLSDTQLILSSPATASYSGTNYLIARQFTTLTAWEDCVDGSGNGGTCAPFPEVTASLVADNRKEVGIAYDDSTFTDNLVIDDSTTDATHFITLAVDPGNRHTGRAGTGVVLDPAAAGHAIEVLDDHTRVEWLEVTGWTGDSSEAVRINADLTSFEYMLLHDGFDTDGQDEADGFYLNSTAGDWTTTIRNSIVYNTGRAGIHLQNLNTANLVATIENVTLYNNGTPTGHTAEETGGISYCVLSTNSLTINARNVLSVGNRDRDNDGDADFNSRNFGCDGTIDWGTSDFNISSDNSAPPSANRWTGVAVDQFVSIVSGSEDLHLKPTSDALDVGTALTSATDIDLESRPKGAQWDIGADEAVASGTCPTEFTSWFDTNWQFRKAIALNSTLVAGPLVNFPVLVALDNDAQVAAAAQADFDDVVFTASDGVTKLPHEIEAFDSGQGDLTAWVKVPYVSNGSDTIVYIYYGNATVGNQQDPTNVWDANFKGIWHLNENPDDPAPQFPDVTANTNDGTANSLTVVNQVPGQIVGSLEFDDTNERHVNVPDDPSLRLSSNMTVSAWINSTDTDPSAAVIVNKWLDLGNKNYWLGRIDSANMLFQVHNDTYLVTAPTALVTDGLWHHIVGVADATAGELRIYVDGVLRNTNGTYPGVSETGTSALQIGKSSDVITQTWFGRIDEVRVSDTARSDSWIETSYNNQLDPIADPAGFCKVCAQTTEVSLASFEAKGVDGAVELTWRTASELNNLGFHVYRATSTGGRYVKVTQQVIPGLGSSPVGASYRYRDAGLSNGMTYHYKLEDIDTSGVRTFHGPVSATPEQDVSSDSGAPRTEENASSRITYGEPSSIGLRVIARNGNEVVLELLTSGFYAYPEEGGTVRVEAPGLETTSEGTSLPVKHGWVEAVAGRKVELLSVEASEVEAVKLRPSGAELAEVVSSRQGTVRVRRRPADRANERDPAGLVPSDWARLLSVGFQANEKKALVELAPLRWDASSGQLLLAKRLRVRVGFRGVERSERGRRRYRRKASREQGQTVVRLSTTEPGLYGVRYEDVFGRRRTARGELRLSRHGEPVAYHVEPAGKSFGPGTVMYFVSDGSEANPYGTEAVYEIEASRPAERMDMVSTNRSATTWYWQELEREENRIYQAALLDAPDVWLWDVVMSETTKAFTFEVRDLFAHGGAPSLDAWLQGTSDFAASPDHHVRVYVNGTLVGETRWDGKQGKRVEVEMLAGVVREGENVLELENVGDTGAAYSMVMLERFRVRYPRSVAALERARYVLDVTDAAPRWVVSRTGFDSERSYLGTDEALRPEVRRIPSTNLRQHRGADYLVIGPQSFLEEAKPLLRHRTRQGLRVATASTEAIASEFGGGELTPESIRELIAHAYHAYHEWDEPKLRYVLLVGDGSYDFKDHLGTGVVNHVPPLMVKTTYLWTASDPGYASVNGDDVLPDVAIGRLPAANASELRAMVDKILAYERGERGFEDELVLVTDDGDGAGNFEGNADEMAARFPGATRKVYLSRLGLTATREAIVESLDEGASLMSYIGHGGIHLWADENLLDTSGIAGLRPQSRQPLLLTMNCLNGYFHFPYFDALSEALVKADGKGAVAAFSPSGLSLDAHAHRYHRALLDELVGSRHLRLGDAVLAAQKIYADSGAFPELLRIFHLIGDPALTLR